MSEHLNEREFMDVVKEIREEQYMRGYKDGFMQGRDVGFKVGIEKGLKGVI